MTSLASQPPAHKPTSLLSLPPELISVIWSHLKHSQSGMRPICPLLPFTRRALFADVHIYGKARLRQFAKILRPRSCKGNCAPRKSTRGDLPLGAHVRTLALSNGEYGSEEEELVRKILAATDKVEDVELSGDALVEILLLKLIPHFSLRRKTNVRLSELYGRTPYEMELLVRLRRFSRLNNLTIDVEEDVAEDTLTVLSQRVRPLDRIKTLILTAGFSLSTSAAANVISHFTSLTFLYLCLRDLCELSPFLPAAPHTLKRHAIEFEYDLELEEDEQVDTTAHIGRFTNFTELSLGKKTWILTLDCGQEPEVHASDVLKYLRQRGGPSRSLSSFTLEAFYSEISVLPSSRPDIPSVASGNFNIKEHLSLPQWTREFDLEDAKEIVRVAGEVGVAFGGTIEEAIDILRVKEEEERYLRDRADDVLLSIVGLFEEAEGM